MPIRVSGMNSGLDTDSIVKELVSAYSTKKDKYTKAQTKLSWKQDAWKDMNKKIYGLYTGISSMRYSTAYNLRKTTVSDATKATVTASNSASNGTQKLNILQTAQAGYLTGAKLDSSVRSSSTLAEIGYTGGDGKIEVALGDGTKKQIEISQTTKVGDVVDSLKKAGLNANYDELNKRFFVSAKNTGSDSDFTLTGVNVDGANALQKLGIAVGDDKTAAAYDKYNAYYADSDDAITANINNAVSAYSTAKAENARLEAENKNLVAAMSYGKAYSAVQDFYAEKGVSADDQKKLASLAALSSSGRDNTLMDADGNVYTKTSGKDQDGNAVYAYRKEDGTTEYAAKVVTYKDTNGKEYKKNSDGEYVSLTDENVTYSGNTKDLTEQAAYKTVSEQVSYKDKDGKEYEKIDENTYRLDGVDYIKNEDGSFATAEQPDQKVEISPSYNYQSETDLAVSEGKDVYAQLLADYNISEEDATAFAKNLAAVNSFEKQSDTLAEDNAFNVANISAAIQEAYAQSGKDGVNALINGDGNTPGFASAIAANKEQINTNTSTMENNEAVANIANMESDSEKQAAVQAMTEQVKSAHELSTNANYSTGATKVTGQDAIIKLNGVEYTSATNNVTVNGLTVTAQAVTGDGDDNAITISTNTDNQGIYDKIKDFLTEYNKVINEMCSSYNAESSKGYEPLTDDEKDAMSDTEVEKWETKIKDSLLRRDGTLGNVMNVMTNAMAKSYEVNGKKYSLSNFGISTLGFLNASANENYAYHIDGDEDDDSTSGKTDKLMAAINEDPDSVIDFMKQLTNGLYSALDDKMKSTSLKSMYNVYNDKEMKNQYKDYTDLISKWEDKISAQEDYYYKKFSAMETALSKLNSQTSSISGLFS